MNEPLLTGIAILMLVSLNFVAWRKGWRWLPLTTDAAVILVVVLDNLSPALDDFLALEFIKAIILLACIFLTFMALTKLPQKIRQIKARQGGKKDE